MTSLNVPSCAPQSPRKPDLPSPALILVQTSSRPITYPDAKIGLLPKMGRTGGESNSPVFQFSHSVGGQTGGVVPFLLRRVSQRYETSEVSMNAFCNIRGLG